MRVVKGRLAMVALFAGSLALMALTLSVDSAAPDVAVSTAFYRCSRRSFAESGHLAPDPWGTPWIPDSRAPWGWRSAGPNRIDNSGLGDDVMVIAPGPLTTAYDWAPSVSVVMLLAGCLLAAHGFAQGRRTRDEPQEKKN